MTKPYKCNIGCMTPDIKEYDIIYIYFKIKQVGIRVLSLICVKYKEYIKWLL